MATFDTPEFNRCLADAIHDAEQHVGHLLDWYGEILDDNHQTIFEEMIASDEIEAELDDLSLAGLMAVQLVALRIARKRMLRALGVDFPQLHERGIE